MKTIFLSLIYLVLIKPVYSQFDYIITKKNDTIRGNIELRKREGHLMRIDFTNELHEDLRIYRADKIKGFFYKNNHYESLAWEEMHYYFERIIKGKLSLYESTYIVHMVPYGTLGGMKSQEVTDYFIRNSSIMTIVKGGNFRKHMITYVRDCPVLVD